MTMLTGSQSPQTVRPNDQRESGVVLVISLLTMTLLSLLGGAAITMSNIEQMMSGNLKTSGRAKMIAAAGIEHGRAMLKKSVLDDVLDGAHANGGTAHAAWQGKLIFSGCTAPTASTDGSCSWNGGTYSVTVGDNDDGDTDITDDIDNIVIIQSTGKDDASGTTVVIQATVVKAPPQMPAVNGAVSMVGEAVTDITETVLTSADGQDWRWDMGTSMWESGFAGAEADKYAIGISNVTSGAGTDASALAALDTDIVAQGGKFVGNGGPPAIGVDDPMASVDLQNFIDLAKGVAIQYTDVDFPGGSIGLLNRNEIESRAGGITYFNLDGSQELSVNQTLSGSGLLIIEGSSVHFSNALDWNGMIINVGTKVGLRFSGGSSTVQEVNGAIIVDEQRNDSTAFSGGDITDLRINSNMKIRYSAQQIALINNAINTAGGGIVRIASYRQCEGAC